jgi:hypothetical protein
MKARRKLGGIWSGSYEEEGTRDSLKSASVVKRDEYVYPIYIFFLFYIIFKIILTVLNLV